jgi:hypothetical protein
MEQPLRGLKSNWRKKRKTLNQVQGDKHITLLVAKRLIWETIRFLPSVEMTNREVD